MTHTDHPSGPGGAHDALATLALLDRMDQEFAWLVTACITTASITSQVIAVPTSSPQNGSITHSHPPEDPWTPCTAPATPISPHPD